MITVEQLEALDMLLWHRSGSAAAASCHCDQSSISRRVDASLKTFRLRIKRDSEYRLLGDQRLLLSQRYVHQQARFIGFGKLPLRLEATHYIRDFLTDPSLLGWVLGPCHHRGYGALLSMLNERIIDAWITSDLLDLPESSDYTVFRLWDWPGELVVNRYHPLAQESRLSLDDVKRFPSLILPAEMYPGLARAVHAKGLGHNMQLTRYDKGSWLGMTEDAVTISYGSCLSTDSDPSLIRLDWDLGLVGGEALVVLSEWADQPAIALLLENLRLRQLVMQHRLPQLIGHL